MLGFEGLAALLVLLAVTTLLAAWALVALAGYPARQVWDWWSGAMLWAMTLGARGRWPL